MSKGAFTKKIIRWGGGGGGGEADAEIICSLKKIEDPYLLH